MSHSSLQTSLEVIAPENEIQLLIEAIAAIAAVDLGQDPEISDALHDAFHDESHDDDRLRGIRDVFESTGGVSLMVSTEREDPEGPLSIYGMENAEVAALGEVIRRTCPSALPMSFAYSYSDSRPQTGAFGGGIVAITADGVDIENTVMLSERFAAETRNDVPLSDLQTAALAAYDGDDGDTLLRLQGRGYNAISRMAYDGGLGDPLALFVIGEVHDAKGDAAQAAEMMRTAVAQLEAVAHALDAIAEKSADVESPR